MRQSMYLEPYLRLTADPKTRCTVGTYLAKTLTGQARTKWADSYQRALVNSLEPVSYTHLTLPTIYSV